MLVWFVLCLLRECFCCDGVLFVVIWVVIVVWGSRLYLFFLGIIGFLLCKWELRYWWISYFFFFLRVFWIVFVYVILNYGMLLVFRFLYCMIFVLRVWIFGIFVVIIVVVVLYFFINLLFLILEMLILVIFLRKRRILWILFLKIVSSWLMFELVKVLEEIWDFLVIIFVFIGRWNMVEFFSLKNFFR